MTRVVSRTGMAFAAAAAAVSVVCALFVPYGHPWVSFAWGVLAAGIVVWVTQSSLELAPRMSDVIRNVESESPRVYGPMPGGAPGTRMTS